MGSHVFYVLKTLYPPEDRHIAAKQDVHRLMTCTLFIGCSSHRFFCNTTDVSFRCTSCSGHMRLLCKKKRAVTFPSEKIHLWLLQVQMGGGSLMMSYARANSPSHTRADEDNPRLVFECEPAVSRCSSRPTLSRVPAWTTRTLQAWTLMFSARTSSCWSVFLTFTTLSHDNIKNNLYISKQVLLKKKPSLWHDP